MAAPTQPGDEQAATPALPPQQSRAREVLRLLVTNRLALAGLIILVGLVLAALFAPWAAPYSYSEINVPNRLAPPSGEHLFGTDQLGRDIFSRVLMGSRISLQVGVVAVGIALVFGVIFGLVSGYYGSRIDDVIMRFMDVLFAFPAILLAIVVLAILGPGITNAMIAIGIVYIPIFARITRASTLSVREEIYVRAARSAGASDARILRLHVLPNVAAPIIVQTSLSLAFAILSEAALSFIGLGAQPPSPAWGAMLADGRGFIGQAWWMAFFPGMAILITVMALNLVGDGLRDALDPRQKSAIESRGAV